MIKMLVKKIWLFFKSFFAKTVVPSDKLDAVYVNDIPGKMKEYYFYIVGESDYHWCFMFLCPCGCKEEIQLNLLEAVDPSWTYKVHGDDSVSVYPSIWRKTGCKSHFWIINSKIKFCS